MSGFISALLKQRKDAKKAQPDTNGRLKEIISIVRKQNYDDGFTPEVILNILQDLGPTYVKLGQIASQQTEYMPAEYSEALAKLRSKVAPMDIETVYAQIEKYLGKPANELFATFSEKALGSASIAQVHKATLKDGTVVAVKVRRPGVVDTVARDFALIEKILDTFVKGNIGGIDVKGLITELEKTSKQELDLTNEADYLDRFWSNNQGREGIICPKCYRELTCEAVLTEDFVKGTEVSNTEFLATLPAEERERLANIVADNFATQVLSDGFYHADPHSGNVFIQTSESGEHTVEWIDFGMMGTLTAKQRQTLIDIVTNIVMKDAYALKRILLTIAQPQGEVNHGEVLGLCEDMCEQFSVSDLGKLDYDLGDLLTSVLDALQGGNYKVDPFLTNLSRGVIAIEGTIKTLSTNVSIFDYFINKVDLGGMSLNLDQEHLKEMNPEIALKLMQLFKGVTDSSVKKAETLDMLQKGQLTVHTDYAFEEKAEETVSRLTRYAVRGLLVAALMLGSALLCTTAPLGPDNVAGAVAFRTVGIIGFLVSIYFGFHLLGKMKKGK